MGRTSCRAGCWPAPPGPIAAVLTLALVIQAAAGSSAVAGRPAASPAAGGGATRTTVTIVVCAPGYPGTTASAQPTMDAFAAAVAAAAGWPSGTIGAAYFETAEAGLKRLADKDAAIALVSLPLFLQHESALRLSPILEAVQESGAAETWGLAAHRGRLGSAAALDGWEITGAAGYAPDFVRGPLLGAWGAPPPGARITFTANVLSALRRAAAGDSVAVLLDSAQTAALASLPFAGDLEIVTRSRPLPGTLLCAVGDRLRRDDLGTLIAGLERLPSRPEWAEVLTTMRLKRFEAADKGGIEAARRACAAARAGRP